MRSYIRVDPELAERKKKANYPDGAFATFCEVLCAAEHQPQRGRFQSLAILRAYLGRRSRWIPFLLEKKDLVLLEGGVLYVEGWDEWQEGDWLVKERMTKVRERRGEPSVDRSPGAIRTAAWRLRKQILERDGYTCQYCGDATYERDWLVLEHVIPNGPSTAENLVAACRPCNKRKGRRTPAQAGMRLISDIRDTSQVMSDASPPSEPLAVSGKRLAVSTSQVVRHENPNDDPVAQLQLWWHEFVGRQISEHDKQAAAAFIVDYPRLGLDGIKARIIEHAAWRVENRKPPLGKLEFYRDTLRDREAHLADMGMMKPRESKSLDFGLTKAFGA